VRRAGIIIRASSSLNTSGSGGARGHELDPLVNVVVGGSAIVYRVKPKSRFPLRRPAQSPKQRSSAALRHEQLACGTDFSRADGDC
jgi:hypothetical protein